MLKIWENCVTEQYDGTNRPETLEMNLGNFNIGGQIIQTVKYADDFVLMAKEETVRND